MSATETRVRRFCIALLALCLLAGCAVGPDFGRPDPPAVTRFGRDADPILTDTALGSAQHFSMGAKVAADWWRLFKSPKLDAWIAEAIAHNPGIEAAQASLRQSQDNLRSGYGIFYPELDASAGASRQKYTAVKTDLDLPPSVFNLFTLSASVSYALDIWGGERRLVEGLGAEVDVARAELQATYLTLWVNIVTVAIAEAAYRAEIDATQHLLVATTEQVRLAEIEAQAGIVPFATVLALRGQRALFAAEIPPLQQKLTQSEDLLATLAGTTPAEWTLAPVELADLTLPSDLPVSLPSDLVSQRPDLIAALAVAHAASANIGVATAAMLPAVSLSSAFGANNTAPSTLFAAEGNFWSFGANATTPLFEGGTLWFRRKAAIAGYQQAMAAYRQSVLAAFAQVADALRGLDHDAATLRAENEALASAEQAQHLVQANYQAGLTTYLDVLTADNHFNQAKIGQLQAIAVRYQDTVALFAALGGGWWNGKSGD